jgi:hypothetical protein
MNFLHYDFQLGAGDVVEVRLDKRANVRLLDDHNFAQYRAGRQHKYRGGLVKVAPFRLAAPHSGHWHLVVDLGGYAGQVKASVNVTRKGKS